MNFYLEETAPMIQPQSDGISLEKVNDNGKPHTDEIQQNKQIQIKTTICQAMWFGGLSYLLGSILYKETWQLCILLSQVQTQQMRMWIAWPLLLLVCFSFAKGSQPDNLLSRWIPLPHNHCSGIKDFKSCPKTTQVRKYREQVCLGITTHTDSYEMYHCQHDSLHGMTYEFFMEPFICAEGYYGSVQYKSRVGVRIVCTPCPVDRYQPVPMSSPQSLQGCHYVRNVVHPEDHLILYRKGTTSLPDIYYCDYLHGFYNEYGELFCDGHNPCRCVSRIERPVCDHSSLDILPDGSCRSKCLYLREADNRFECVSNNTRSSQAKDNSTVSNGTSTNNNENSDSGWETFVPVVLMVAFVVGSLIAVICCVRSPPGLPVVMEITSTAATVAWDKSFLKCKTPVTSYIINVKTTNQGWQQGRTLTIKRCTSNIVVSDLIPDTSYQIQVIAKTGKINSKPSRPSAIFTTKPNDQHAWIASLPMLLQARQIEERDISKLAQALGSDWEIIMYGLHLTKTQIDQAKMSNQYSPANQIVCALNTWRVRDPAAATWERFLRTCANCKKCTIEWPQVKRIVAQLR